MFWRCVCDLDIILKLIWLLFPRSECNDSVDEDDEEKGEEEEEEAIEIVESQAIMPFGRKTRLQLKVQDVGQVKLDVKLGKWTQNKASGIYNLEKM